MGTLLLAPEEGWGVLLASSTLGAQQGGLGIPFLLFPIGLLGPRGLFYEILWQINECN